MPRRRQRRKKSGVRHDFDLRRARGLGFFGGGRRRFALLAGRSPADFACCRSSSAFRRCNKELISARGGKSSSLAYCSIPSFKLRRHSLLALTNSAIASENSSL